MTREASERLLALARHAARICHDWQFDAAENIDEIDAGHKGGFGGFDTCPHPDCVLVRDAAAGETREKEKIARACSCQEPDPVMQADGRFYCYTCSFQTGARPRSLEPEDAWRLRKQLTALKRYTVVSDTPSDYADPNGAYVRYADLLNALRE